MPRTARKMSQTGIYHVMLRGINKQTIFFDDEDNEKFLWIISDCKEVSGFKLYGYCLMGNHAHILLEEGKESIAQIFKRIGIRYVYWYNQKYNRSGHLFQDRYKSEPVGNDSYLTTVLRYIHRNPVKAGLCKSVDEYRWSSYYDYIKDNKLAIVDTDFILSIIGKKNYVKYMNETTSEQCLDCEEVRKHLSDDDLVKEIEKRFNMKAHLIAEEQRKAMLHILREILKIEGVSTRQLSRVTGIPLGVIWRV